MERGETMPRSHTSFSNWEMISQRLMRYSEGVSSVVFGVELSILPRHRLPVLGEGNFLLAHRIDVKVVVRNRHSLCIGIGCSLLQLFELLRSAGRKAVFGKNPPMGSVNIYIEIRTQLLKGQLRIVLDLLKVAAELALVPCPGGILQDVAQDIVETAFPTEGVVDVIDGLDLALSIVLDRLTLSRTHLRQAPVLPGTLGVPTHSQQSRT